jgi:hypothetical protein
MSSGILAIMQGLGRLEEAVLDRDWLRDGGEEVRRGFEVTAMDASKM